MIAIIEKSPEGLFAVYCEEIAGAYGYGESEEEAKGEFIELAEEQAEYYKERRGVYPDWYPVDEWEYRYNLSGFFLAFPFFNVSKLAECLGINPSLMRKYKEGHATASPRQKELIQARYQDLIQQLASVKF